MKQADRVEILVGDVRAKLADIPSDSVDCVVTSPPYWGLRDYGAEGQIGLERTLGDHLAVVVDVFREVRRVLKPTGVCWINYGDCYATAPNGRSAADTKALSDDDRTFRDKPFSTVGAIYDPSGGAPGGGARGKNKGNDGRSTAGRVVAVFDPEHRASTSKQRNRQHGTAAQGGRVVAGSGGYLKPKDLCMVPQRLFIALQDDGWWVRSVLPWVKRNGMPESIADRPANSLEYVAMLTKSERYFYDPDAVRKRASTDTHARAGKIKVPGGWDTGKGAHGTRHRSGRTVGEYRDLPGVTPKSAGEDTNIKAKGSFHASTTEVLNDRNFRNTDLFYSSLSEPWGLISGADGLPLAIDANPAGFSEAHFATFPPALIEPLIKAGSSAGGVCPHCGVPWGSVVESSPMIIRKSDRNDERGTRTGTSGTMVEPPRRRIMGYEQSCDCPYHEPEPSRILDPFGGAGTTGLVAASLGRQCTLIELNPEYANLARARIEAAFMGREEGQRHMVKQLGKLDVGAGPLFDAIG